MGFQGCLVVYQHNNATRSHPVGGRGAREAGSPTAAANLALLSLLSPAYPECELPERRLRGDATQVSVARVIPAGHIRHQEQQRSHPGCPGQGCGEGWGVSGTCGK